jgi:hypothetical protein
VEPIEDAGALELRPLRGIREAPTPEAGPGRWPWIAGGAAAALLAALGAVFYLRRRPRRLEPPVPPHEIAYEQLRRLVAMDLLAKGSIERFFVLLSGILREYIENRFQVRAPERTTEEFLEEVSRNPALEVHRTRLGEFLALSDRVKFAQFRPEEAAIQGAFDVTKRFIEETTRREP